MKTGTITSFLLTLLVLGCTRSTSESVKAQAVFGSVKECVLPFSAPCERHLFQFRNGQIFADGHGPGTTQKQFEQDRQKIESAGGVDLCVYGGASGFQWAGEGCLFALLPQDNEWDQVTANQVVTQMQSIHFVSPQDSNKPYDPFAPVTNDGFGISQLEAQDLPINYLFKTTGGEIGVIKLLDIVEDERGHSGSGKHYGIKFNYKLVNMKAI